MSMTLRNKPWEPTEAEARALQLLIATNMPSGELDEEWVCYNTASRAEISKVINKKDQWYIVGQTQSNMHYKVFCDRAIHNLALTVSSLLSVIILLSF